MYENDNTMGSFDAAAGIERARNEMAGYLLKCAIKLQVAHKRNLSIANPPPKHSTPSKVSEFPRARTFNLRDAVAIEPRNRDDIKRLGFVRVGVLTSATYGPILSGPKFKRKGIADTHSMLVAAGAYGVSPRVG